jgi:transposase-like protein
VTELKQAAETIYQALIDAELTAVIGAGPHERTDTRLNQRNGSRPRTISTTAGDQELRIPKLRSGSFFPALLERRRRVNQCLFPVVMEAYCTAPRRARLMTWSKHWAPIPGSPRAKSRASAPTWTPKLRRFGTAH